jgi:DNA polymerase III subunit gamma/tau
MAYQVLARKWRPQQFSQLIGQQPIVTALRNALSEGRIAQAYLFSGIRGVGKTTAARLLAKALNCEHGPTPEPCDECVACREITLGSDLDVREVDAATYSKVEQVRELTESLKYGPARDRYKVAVLDEVHRLSRQAFDALLKIVEEPPPHLVFVFATTEAEAVPATILSRCQEFHFRRVPAPELAAHLRTICDAETITAGDAALRLIARAGEGSVRDAVALLDQLATFGSGTIADEDAARLLGGLDAAFLGALLEAILGGHPEEIGRLVGRLEDEGWDPRHAYNQFLAYCRDALHLALVGDRGGREQIDLPKEESEALAAVAREAGYENLLRLLQQLLASEPTVRRSESAGLALEIALLRAAELPKLTRVEELLAGAGAAAGGGAGVGRGSRATRPAPAARSRARSHEIEEEAPTRREPPAAGTAELAPAPKPRPSPGPAPAAGSVIRDDEGASDEAPAAQTAAAAPATSAESAGVATDGDLRWESFLEEVSRRKPPLAAHLRAAQRHRFADGRLTIFLPPDDPWLGNALKRPSNAQVTAAAVVHTWGDGTEWEAREGEPAAGVAAGEEPSEGTDEEDATATVSTHAEVAEIPAVQTVLELFQGRVETVEERGSATEEP